MQTHSFYRILLLIGFICSVAIARAGDGGGGVVAKAILDGSKSEMEALKQQLNELRKLIINK